ncbi:hypothetical protein BDZ91DRAFT_269892 [Kalaharituber pfeilii]|nr:hypothetical protein BDZ91DRAFT_269892 [Kalaharituber pfeilii]
MQYDPPTSPYPNPFTPPYAYYPTPPPPNFANTRAHTFYEYTGAGSIPTPAPSPRIPQHSRRRSHDYTSEFPGMRRAATYDHPEFSPHDYPPPRPHTRAGATYMHTPPPTSHGSHGAPPFFSPYMSSFAAADYFPAYPGHAGPQSPPPRDRTRSSRSHRRESTWAAGEGTRSPPRPSVRRAKTTGADGPTIDPEEQRAKAIELGIPPDYSLKNWDPNERPIILLGSVFDANSLGEWIFNWTKFHHGRFHEATKVAGQLWELLIIFSGKYKRADEFVDLITRPEKQIDVKDFLDSGEKLWGRLKTLLSACEKYMWNGAKSSEKGYQMGRKSGAEFVDAMFNDDKEWNSTEKLMRYLKTWCDRFDVNCEDILRRPDA